MSTVNTNAQALFGRNGYYYAQADISYTKDPKNKQFTVTVNGVRVYSKYGYNFKNYLYAKLGDKEDTGTIAASGSNSYKGWLPSSGYSSEIWLQKTYNYNSDGSVPNVYFYLKAYNSSVKWINAGITVSAYTATGDLNISSHIGTLDVSAPTFNLSKSTESIGNIGFSASTTNGYKVNLWQVKVDNGNVYEYTGDYSLSQSYSVSNGTHTIYVRARNDYNNVWSDWRSVWCDCRVPNINNASFTATSVNGGTLSFSSDYSCKWRLSGNDIDTGWQAATKSVSKTLNAAYNKDAWYTLQVQRNDNQNLSNSTSVRCNTIIPSLKIDSVTTLGNTISLSVSCSNVQCKNWVIRFSSDTDFQEIKKADTGNSISGTISNCKFNEPYTITVTATNTSNNLSSSVSSSGHTCVGCVRIFTNANSSALGSVFVYNGKEWKGAVPYVYDGTTWRQCT